MNGVEEPSPRSCSQAGGRRSASRPPSHLHSDCPPEQEDDSPSLGQRSVSLTTLQPTVIQPRMAQLETLEAKMASIEVSLSSTPRRKKNGCLGSVSLGSSIRSIPREIATKELENLRNALKDKENIIQNLKGQLTIPGLRLLTIKNNANNNNSIENNRELTENEKKQAEERLNRLKIDIDNKRLAIKNLKMALERLDITDNIDVRIQQAELEYQLGREELNLLTLLEETRALQLCLEESNKSSSESNTLFSCVHNNEHTTLVAVELEFDPKSPKFGAGQKEEGGLWIDWALDESGLYKEDRMVEVNGKIVLTKTRDDLARLLAAAPDPAQIVVLRKRRKNAVPIPSVDYNKEVIALRSELDMIRERAEEAQRAKDSFRSDNIRLTHRISYLEEQVSDLLNRKASESDVRILTKNPIVSTVKTNQNITNINITSQTNGIPSSNTNCTNPMQLFQKGPQVTTLLANIPGLQVTKDSHISLPVRSKSSLSNISNTQIITSNQQPIDTFNCLKGHRHKHRTKNGMHASLSTQTLDQTNDSKITYRKNGHHHHHYREKDYSSETNSAIEQISRYNKKNVENGHRHPIDYQKNGTEKEDIMDQSFQKATKIVHELTRNRDTLYEKHRQKCLMASEKYNGDILKHYNSRKSTSVLDFRSEIHIGPKYSDSKSVEDLDAPVHSTNGNSRLYHKSQNSNSVKSLDFDSDCNSTITSSRTNILSKTVDYTSEPLENNRKLSHYFGDHIKSRPTPPKKPLRLSLHKTQSLQSVETPPAILKESAANKNDSRKSLKRNYRGLDPNGEPKGHVTTSLKWNCLNQNIRGLENGTETGSWC